MERIKNLNIPIDLPETVNDARVLQQLFINTLGVLPENSIVMAENEDQDKIIQQVDTTLGSLDREDDKAYFNGPKKKTELEKHLETPSHIPKEWMPAIKFHVGHQKQGVVSDEQLF